MQDSDKEHHPILQGWLEKEKRSSSLLSSSTTKRWFTIESTGTDVSLSYYKSPRANSVERCGWIFLADVESLDEFAESNKVTLTTNNDSRRKSIGDEDKQWVIIIHHPSRTFRLRAKDRYQHRLWFDTLKAHCVNAKNKEEKEVSVYTWWYCIIALVFEFKLVHFSNYIFLMSERPHTLLVFLQYQISAE